ncbi:MAG: hypothetical protein V7642_3779 [Burkholderiales bacterium]|jgi:DNA-directed RNA polymerase subunit RPC12/RpoP
MKCPHCSAKVGLFSKEMNKLGKKVCPHCEKGVKVVLIHSNFALGFVPVAVVAILLGASGPIAAGIAGGAGALMGMGLKPTEG